MIDLGGFGTLLTLDPQRYTKTLDKTMEVQLRQAARAWLRAVIVKVPVWTGMSRGSLIPLGAFLRVKIPITPVASKPGMGPLAGSLRSSFNFTKRGTSYSFEFDESVAHYTINEFFDVSHTIKLITPGPYNSFRFGAAAFQAYVTNELPKRLPRVEDVIVTKRIVLGAR